METIAQGSSCPPKDRWPLFGLIVAAQIGPSAVTQVNLSQIDYLRSVVNLPKQQQDHEQRDDDVRKDKIHRLPRRDKILVPLDQQQKDVESADEVRPVWIPQGTKW